MPMGLDLSEFPSICARAGAVFFREGRGKAALALESNAFGNFGYGHGALAQEEICLLHPVLPCVRRDRHAVFCLECLLERRRVDMEFSRKLLDGHALAEMLNEVVVNLSYGIGARCAYLMGGARDLHDRLDHRMHRAAYLVIRDFIINLPAIAARVDEPAIAQGAQMMRHGGARDSENRGESADAALTVAKDPEHLYPCGVADGFEKFGGCLELLARNSDMTVLMCTAAAMI